MRPKPVTIQPYFSADETLRRIKKLTPTFQDVLIFYCYGYSIAKIAEKTHHSYSTVKQYLSNIYSMLEMNHLDKEERDFNFHTYFVEVIENNRQQIYPRIGGMKVVEYLEQVYDDNDWIDSQRLKKLIRITIICLLIVVSIACLAGLLSLYFTASISR